MQGKTRAHKGKQGHTRNKQQLPETKRTTRKPRGRSQGDGFKGNFKVSVYVLLWFSVVFYNSFNKTIVNVRRVNITRE